MKNSIFKNLTLLLFTSFTLPLLVVGCSNLELTPEEKLTREKAKDVGIITNISALEMVELKEVGLVKCEIYWKYYGKSPEEHCRDDLKLHAAELGGTLVLVEKRETFKCTAGTPDSDCVRMSGHAYLRRGK